MADDGREILSDAKLELLRDLTGQVAALTDHTTKLTNFVMAVDARVAGAQAVAAVVDENEDRVVSHNWLRAQKEAISHFYGEAQRYTTIVIAGAYVAYFTTLSSVSARFSDSELLWSAMLMTVSVTIFVLYEVVGIAVTSWRALRGNLEGGQNRAAATAGWGLAMIGTLLTAIPAIAISVITYAEGLGIGDFVRRLFH